MHQDIRRIRLFLHKKSAIKMKAIISCLAAVILLTACSQSSKTVYHSEYQSSNIEAMQKTYDFIKKNCHSTYFIATTDGEQPRVRPFGTINIFEGKLYIQTGHKKDVAKQIAANPLVELCAFDGQATWLRLSGVLIEDERIEAKKAMLDAYPELRSMYDENDDNTAVYYFKDVTARFDSFVKEQEIEKF